MDRLRTPAWCAPLMISSTAAGFFRGSLVKFQDGADAALDPAVRGRFGQDVFVQLRLLPGADARSRGGVDVLADADLGVVAGFFRPSLCSREPGSHPGWYAGVR